MTIRTITALFDSEADAERARQELSGLGLEEGAVRVVNQQSGLTTRDEDDKGFWESIKDFFVADDDRDEYQEGLRRGGYLLTAQVEDEYADEAIDILENSAAVDLTQRAEQWQAEGWTRTVSGRPEATEQSIPIAEERLRVGKREVERGTVRVRSYVVEEPVHEEVRLRNEQVKVEHRPVEGQASAANRDELQERTIEMTETSEEPVVSKDAVVTEEVVVGKFTGERTEGIDETVRRTEVEVDDSRKEAQEPASASSGKSRRKPEERRRPQ